MASVAADWRATTNGTHSPCSDYGRPLRLRGTCPRMLAPHGGQEMGKERRPPPPNEDPALLSCNRMLPIQKRIVLLTAHIPSFVKPVRRLTFMTREATETARFLREHAAPPCTPDTFLSCADSRFLARCGTRVPGCHVRHRRACATAGGDSRDRWRDAPPESRRAGARRVNTSVSGAPARLTEYCC